MLDDNNENIPYQLSRVVEKGQEGLEGYSKLLKNIKSVLAKNENMVSSLSEYSSKIKKLQQKNEQLTLGMKQISGDVSSQDVLMLKMARQKDRINDLLGGMFSNLNK